MAAGKLLCPLPLALLLLAFWVSTLYGSPAPSSPPPVKSANFTREQVMLHSEIRAFFLDHYSLGPCARAILRNNSCPGAEHRWTMNYTSVDELKTMCADLSTFSSCLRGSICKSCRDKQGAKSPAVLSYYCSLGATPSALAVCQTMVEEQQPSVSGTHLLLFVTFAFFSLALFLFSRLLY